MQQRIDGSFSETKTYSELMKLMQNPEEVKNTRAIHFGTHDELDEIRNEKSLKNKVDDLQNQVDELKAGQQNKSEYFVFPTDEEIKKYGSKGPMERNMLKIMSGIAQK